MEVFPKNESYRFKALGTEIELAVLVENAEQLTRVRQDFAKVQTIYAEFEKIFSRFDQESELCQLNANLGKWQAISAAMKEIVTAALYYHEETAGFFDPRIIGILENIGYKNDFKQGNFTRGQQVEKDVVQAVALKEELKLEGKQAFFSVRMDFSGIAKGYITDKVAEFLRQAGWRNFLVDSGGDMYFAGKQSAKERGWRIAIEGVSEEKASWVLSEMAIATSGTSRRKWEITGERFHHLINPKDLNRFDFELKSVTVIARSTEEADVWAKTLFLLGKKEGKEWAQQKKIGAIFLDCRGNAWLSTKAKEFLG